MEGKGNVVRGVKGCMVVGCLWLSELDELVEDVDLRMGWFP